MKTLLEYVPLLGAATAFLAATSCSSLPIQTQQKTGDPTYPPRDPATVQILREPPRRPNVKLGEITAEPKSVRTPLAEVEAKFRTAGAKMGADAVVIVVETKLTGATARGRWWDGQFSPNIGQVFVGVPIRYTQQKVAGKTRAP